MSDKLSGMYTDLAEHVLNTVKSGEFGDYFGNICKNSDFTIEADENYVSRKVDLRWVEAIESTISALDRIIRQPGRFIRREEQIVPIENAKEISAESVRHLAQHTNMIHSVCDGIVTPSRILSVSKEESLETYENRFIYTLLGRIRSFLDARVNLLLRDISVSDVYKYELSGTSKSGDDRISYEIRLNYTTPHTEIDGLNLLEADVNMLGDMQRVERLVKITDAFLNTAFIRQLKGTPPVRSPLSMTNVLKKNPNYQKCVYLWGFLGSYNEKGFEVEYVRNQGFADCDEKNELLATVLLQYIMFKKLSKAEKARIEKQRAAEEEARKAEELLKKALEAQRLAQIEEKSKENLIIYENRQNEKNRKKQNLAKYNGMSRKEKKAAQKRDGVYGKKEVFC